MRDRIYFLILSILIVLGSQAVFGQPSADSLQPAQPEKVLPQIQLQEYTIVGLAKISLPRKIRTQVFKEVDIEWSDNQDVYIMKQVFYSICSLKLSRLFPISRRNFYAVMDMWIMPSGLMSD
jgi:hypothetical protein